MSFEPIKNYKMSYKAFFTNLYLVFFENVNYFLLLQFQNASKLRKMWFNRILSKYSKINDNYKVNERFALEIRR